MMSDKPEFSSNSATPPDPGISLCMLASGSKGNSIYVSDGRTAILVDAGLSGIEIERRMKSRDLSPESLNAIVVSHEHEDHIRGVGVLSRRYGLPVYISAKTAAASPQLNNLKQTVSFNCGDSFNINTLNIHPFSISHDAADPAGFTIALNQKKIGIVTDLGIATAMVRHHLQSCDLLILEGQSGPCRVTLAGRPSGTEPKIKFYLFSNVSPDLPLSEAKTLGQQSLVELESELKKWLVSAI